MDKYEVHLVSSIFAHALTGVCWKQGSSTKHNPSGRFTLDATV